MEKSIRLLAVLLGVQLLLAVGLSLTGPDLGAQTDTAPLLTVEKEKVDRLILEGPDQAKVTLARVEGAWRLPETGDFPADGGKVGQLLDRLTGLRQGLAVATTQGARERFKVSDDAFERRITLGSGENTLATLYLGTSPGVRRVHARNADQEAIYGVELGLHDAPVKAEEWQDKTILRIPQAEITSIATGTLDLTRSTEAVTDKTDGKEADNAAPPAARWQSTGLKANERLKPEAADRLAELLAQLRIGGVLGREERPDYGLKAPVLSLSVTRKDGELIEYRLGKVADKEEYTLKASNRPEYFRLPSYAAKPLIEAAARDALVGPAVEATTPPSEPSGG